MMYDVCCRRLCRRPSSRGRRTARTTPSTCCGTAPCTDHRCTIAPLHHLSSPCSPFYDEFRVPGVFFHANAVKTFAMLLKLTQQLFDLRVRRRIKDTLLLKGPWVTQPHVINQNGATSVLLSDPSTFGAGCPNQNTSESRIKNKQNRILLLFRLCRPRSSRWNPCPCAASKLRSTKSTNTCF